MQSFYFMRHGNTDWNVEKRIQGSIDIPLNAEGRAQAAAAAKQLEHAQIDGIITSPATRARETAEIICQATGLPLVEVHPELHDRDFGDLEGEMRDKLLALVAAQTDEKFLLLQAPNGEHWEDMRERISSTMTDILTRHGDKRLLVVGHHMVWVAFMQALSGELILDIEHSQPYRFLETEQGGWSFEKIDGSIVRSVDAA